MSLVDGNEFIQQVNHMRFDTPIIILSQYAAPNKALGEKDQIIAYINKPIKRLKLDSIFFRLALDHNRNPIKLTDPDIANATPFEATQPPRILVIDDDSLTRKLLFTFLHVENYQTELACDGYEGLDKWANNVHSDHPFDLLIIDLQMPNIDGFALLKKIRQTDSNIPIIVLTGHSNLDNAYALLKTHQISDLLSKPLDGCERLLFTVKNTLEKYHLNKTLKSFNQELEQRVRQRTAQLQQAKEETEAANLEKTLSHPHES
jgi:DNA-binding NtrC family response regulator